MFVTRQSARGRTQMLDVEAILFNHDPLRTAGCGLNLRRNARELVELPEWRRAVTVAPEDSPVAYDLDDQRGRRAPIIMARFRRQQPGITTAQVRAIPIAPPINPWRPSYLLHPQLIWPGNYWFTSLAEYVVSLVYTAYYRWWQSSESGSAPNILGSVAPRWIELAADGTSSMEPFELHDSLLSNRGVGVWDIRWQWQYRLGLSDPWRDMQTTAHRVYTVLQVPTAPWVQQPFRRENTQLPWTEVLDVACRWASGARSPVTAATSVTEVVFGLGDRLLEYGCPIGALTMYASFLGEDVFNCTAFLDRLNLGPGNGKFVNCSDCAAIVSTFANILGCDLWQSRMGSYFPAFETNPIQAIGSHAFESPCGWGLGFTYHEVAWTNECTEADNVFDACLKVLTASLSGSPVPASRLATNLQFGESGEGLYRDLIAAPTGRAACMPRPAERSRRPVI